MPNHLIKLMDAVTQFAEVTQLRKTSLDTLDKHGFKDLIDVKPGDQVVVLDAYEFIALAKSFVFLATLLRGIKRVNKESGGMQIAEAIVAGYDDEEQPNQKESALS